MAALAPDIRESRAVLLRAGLHHVEKARFGCNSHGKGAYVDYLDAAKISRSRRE